MPDAGRRPYVAANWKMNKTTVETEDFFERFIGWLGGLEGVDVALAPPFTSLAVAVDHARRSPVAGRRPERPRGRSRGRSPARSRSRCSPTSASPGAIIGHSERRQLFGETDEALARKVPALLERRHAGDPVLRRDRGRARRRRDGGRARRQLEADLAEVEDADLARLVIAYEPIWAIGTGRTATPEQAEEAIAFIRGLVAARSADAAADACASSTAAR